MNTPPYNISITRVSSGVTLTDTGMGSVDLTNVELPFAVQVDRAQYLLWPSPLGGHTTQLPWPDSCNIGSAAILVSGRVTYSTDAVAFGDYVVRRTSSAPNAFWDQLRKIITQAERASEEELRQEAEDVLRSQADSAPSWLMTHPTFRTAPGNAAIPRGEVGDRFRHVLYKPVPHLAPWARHRPSAPAIGVKTSYRTNDRNGYFAGEVAEELIDHWGDYWLSELTIVQHREPQSELVVGAAFATADPPCGWKAHHKIFGPAFAFSGKVPRQYVTCVLCGHVPQNCRMSSCGGILRQGLFTPETLTPTTHGQLLL